MASRSLGTLTLDLVAKTGGFVQGMDKAERQSKKWRKQVEKDLQQVSKAAKTGLIAISGAAIGAGAALAAMTAKGLQSVDVQNKMARSFNTSYDSLTALNFAFEEAGVDGYESSLNRLNRRLGAAEMGTGAAAKTVKALNLDLAALSEMDVDERVASISDAIRDSGASAQLAARYAQDLGFEQKEAAQFFLQGGDAIRSYRKEVDAFGLSVSDIDAAKIEQANDAFGRTGKFFEGLSNQLAIQVAPILTGISELFVQNAKDAGDLGDAARDGFNLLIDAAGFAADSVDGIARIFKLAGSTAAVVALEIKHHLLDVAEYVVNYPIKAVNQLIDDLNSILGIDIKPRGFSDLGSSIVEEMELTKGAIEEGKKDFDRILMAPLPSTQFKKFVEDARQSANDAAEATLAANKKIRDALGSSTSIPGDDPKKRDADLAKRLESLTQHFENEKQTILRLFGERDAEITALEEARTLSEMAAADLRYKNEVEKIEKLAELRKKNEELAYWDKWMESAEKNLQNFDELSKTVIDNFTNGFGNAFESIIIDSESLDDALKGIAETILRGVVNSIGQMAAQWLALQAVQAIMGTSATAATIAQATAASAAWAPAAAMASLATLGGNAIPAAAALTSTAALSSTLSVVGMAHDGIDSVPREGTWLLDKGERVVTADTSAKLDATLDRIAQSGGGGGTVVNINNAPAGTRTEERTDSQGNRVVDVFVADMANGGPMSRTMQSTYGLKRQGR